MRGDPARAAGAGYTGVSQPDRRVFTYQLTRELDDDMLLRMHLMVDQRTEVVPLELRDLKLP